MKRIFALFTLFFTLSLYAQHTDTTSPFILEHKVVTDTIRAIELADSIKAGMRNRKQYLAAIDSLLQEFIENRFRKIKSAQEKEYLFFLVANYPKCLQSPFHYSKENHDEEEITRQLEKGKIHRKLRDAFPNLKMELNGDISRINKREGLDFSKLLTSLPEKTITLKLENPYYVDSAFHWLDRNNFELQHVKTSYPVKEEYSVYRPCPQFKFIWGNYENYWLVFDNSNKLVATTKRPDTHYDSNFRDKIINLCAYQDFENNAYDISSESKQMQEYVRYTLENGRSMKDEIFSLQFSMKFMDKLMAELRNKKMRGMMSESDYQKNLRDCTTGKAKSKKQLSDLNHKLPAKEVIDKADNYVEQLKRDNEPLLPSYSCFRMERIDGLHILLVTPSGLKVLQTASYDEAKKEVNWTYAGIH